MLMNMPIQKITLLTLGALLSIMLGYISFKFLPDVIVKQIQYRIKLEPSSPVYELWRDAPIDIYHRFYFFNITNPIEIEREGAKPDLREVGPFVYNLKVKKVPVIDNENDTVSYHEVKQWFFNAELSAYDEDYVITTVNSPLISALNFIQRAPQPLRTWISVTLDTITEGIFIRRSIKQLTFYGYPDLLVSIGRLIDPKTPNNHGRFAYLALKNNSADAEYTVFSGSKAQTKLGLVERVDGLNYIEKWKDFPCRNLSDTYTGQLMYSPMESSRSNIQMFNDMFGRKLNLKYRSQIESYPGVQSYRYSFDVNNFKNSLDYPPNSCYTSRLPKEMYDTHTNSSSGSQIAVERTNSPGSLLLDLARRRFGDSSAGPLANLFNRNILSGPLLSIANNDQTVRQPIATSIATTMPTTPSIASTSVLSETANNNNAPLNDESAPETPLSNEETESNSRSNNPAESLIMSTTEINSLDSPTQLNAHLKPTIATGEHRPKSSPSVVTPARSHIVYHPDDSNLPRDANLFARTSNTNAESRNDQFGPSLSNVISNRVGESPLLSLFVPRESANSPLENSSRLNGRLFNRNGNNVLGNLISNGLNRLLNLRNARRMEDSSHTSEPNAVINEPNRTVLSRSVRNALRRVVRNTGSMPPQSMSSDDKSAQFNHNSQSDSLPHDSIVSRTSPEEYIALRKQNMFPSGAFDFSQMAFGAPILLSQPHFLNADSYYSERVNGMKPDADKHDFFIDIEPITGSSVRTAIRLQVNVALLKSPNVFRFRNFKENIFPVFWQEIEMDLPENCQTLLRMAGTAPNVISEIVLCLCLIVSLSLFTSAVFVLAKARAQILSEKGHYVHSARIASENVAVLNGHRVDNKFANMAFSSNIGNNNNNEDLTSFNKHKSKVIFTMVPESD